MSIFRNHFPLMGAAGQSTGYEIDQSIRFDQGANAYLSRTPSSAGNRRNWTFSAWIKFSMHSTNGYHNIFAVRQDSNDYFEMAREVNNSGDYRLAINNQVSGTNSFYFITNRQFRDPAAWYHLVFVADTTHASTDERFRLYINGDRETVFDTYTMPTQNYDTHVNTTNVTAIGTYPTSSGYDMDGYMAEIHFLDGYSYGPEFFGESDNYGNWIPKEYTGSHGTNGAYITGSDSSNLGKNEASANTYAAFASTNLAAHDQMTDTPTNNFSVMNPLANYYVQHTLKNGMLEELTSTNGSYYSYSINNIGMTSGKWYVEVLFSGSSAAQMLAGISDREPQGGQHYLGSQSYEYSYYNYNGKSITGTTQSSFGSTYTQNDIIGIALDLDNSKLYFSKNGTFQNSGDPTSGSSGTGALSITAVGSTQNGFYYFGAGDYSSSYATTYIWNFGQDGTFAGNVTAGGNSDENSVGNFKYSVPSGYLALCTQNLWESS